MATFPLTLKIDQGSIPYKMTVKDAAGSTCMQAVQLRNLKRQIEITTYQNHQQQIYQVAQEKLLSMRPVYDIWNQQGQTIGTIALQNPLGNCQYNVFDGKNCVFHAQRESHPPRVKVLLLGITIAIVMLSLIVYVPTMMPLFAVVFGVGLFASRGGYFGTPTYTVKRPNGRRVMQFAQIPGFNLNQLQFSIRLLDRINSTEEHSALCAITLMLLERSSSAD
jgi:hypothetical protein